MKSLRHSIRFSALLFLLLTLHTLALTLAMPEPESATFQKQLACTASIAANDDFQQPDEPDFKPPKNSYIDYTTFFDPHCLIPGYAPDLSELLTHEPKVTRLKVYLEIDVPPDSLA
jgi:hypothetical protein